LTAYREIMSRSAGNEKMQEIARAIQEGGRAFLHAEYRWLGVFVAVVFLAISLAPPPLGVKTAFAFLLGAALSATAGYYGMHTSTRAAVRTTEAARTSLGQALNVSFLSGSVMGMSVVGLGMVGICLLTFAYGLFGADSADTRNLIAEQILG